jgi:hypothetical protein
MRLRRATFMMSFLSFYRDPIVAKWTEHSDFHITDLQDAEHPLSLYLVTSPVGGPVEFPESNGNCRIPHLSQYAFPPTTTLPLSVPPRPTTGPGTTLAANAMTGIGRANGTTFVLMNTCPKRAPW